MLQYTEFLRIEKIKKMLDFVAYGSLVFDIAIAVVTLISLNAYSQQLNKIQYFLNIALTVEIVFAFILLVALIAITHYDRVLDNLARFSSMLTGKNRYKHR